MLFSLSVFGNRILLWKFKGPTLDTLTQVKQEYDNTSTCDGIIVVIFFIVIIIVIVHWFIAAHLWKQLFSGKVTANAFSSAPAKQQDNNIDIFLSHFLN